VLLGRRGARRTRSDRSSANLRKREALAHSRRNSARSTCCVRAASATIQSAGRLFGSRQPVLFLTREGFKDIRISSEWIPWSMILSAKDYRGKGLVLDVAPQFMSRLRLSFVTRFTGTANRLFGYRGLWVVAFPLANTSTRALLEVMRDRIGRGQSTG
jgi:hypothetical protein